MTDADAARRRLDMYLGELRGALRALPEAERDEILAELRSHVLDRASGEAGLTDEAVRKALDGLGAPRVLAAGYVGRAVAERVEVSRSPWRILMGAWRLTSLSVSAFGLFIVSLTGYGVGASFVLVALAKPFFPDKVGMWVRGHGQDFTVNIGANDAPHLATQEMLGWWIIPLGLVLGAAILWATWRLGLAWVRALGRKGPTIGAGHG